MKEINVIAFASTRANQRLSGYTDKHGTGGTGDGGGMEYRIDRLEADVKEIKSDIKSVDGRLRSVETGLATLTERVAHLPSKEYLVRTVFGGVALVGAIVLFADNLKKLIGIG